MAVVQLMIGERKYVVSCGDGQEENLKRLAVLLDEKVMQVKNGALVPEALGLVMGGLLLANDLTEARGLTPSGQAFGVQPDVLEQMTQLIEKTAVRISAVAETIENA